MGTLGNFCSHVWFTRGGGKTFVGVRELPTNRCIYGQSNLHYREKQRLAGVTNGGGRINRGGQTTGRWYYEKGGGHVDQGANGGGGSYGGGQELSDGVRSYGGQKVSGGSAGVVVNEGPYVTVEGARILRSRLK